MNKKKKINRIKVDTVRSVNNNIRSSVRKLNPILKAIVGKKVDVAIRELQFSAKRITREIRKTVSSAIANEIGRAHVWTPVTVNNLVCRLLLEKKKK